MSSQRWGCWVWPNCTEVQAFPVLCWFGLMGFMAFQHKTGYIVSGRNISTDVSCDPSNMFDDGNNHRIYFQLKASRKVILITELQSSFRCDKQLITSTTKLWQFLNEFAEVYFIFFNMFSKVLVFWIADMVTYLIRYCYQSICIVCK